MGKTEATGDAVLALADGTVFRGRAFGAVGEASGELVFNTSMTGYQEILTDPSYEGQLVAMTYPEIGNVGVNREDVESRRPFVRGFVVREYREVPSSWRAEQSLGAYLAHWDIPGIEGIDTRALVRHLRDHGAQEAVLSSVDLDADAAGAQGEGHARAGRARPGAASVTCARAVRLGAGALEARAATSPPTRSRPRCGRPTFKVVAYDYGIKYNILRNLVGVGCAVRVVPASTPARDVLALRPDGVFLSNGPGDPDAVAGAPENVAALLGRGARLRHLPRPPDPRARARRQHLQAQVRPSRRQPAGEGPDHRQGRDHGAEPRLRGRHGLARRPRRGDAREPERPHRRGPVGEGPAHLLGAVPSRGVARPARRALSVPPLRRADGARSAADAEAHRHPLDPADRLRPDRHRPGVRVRLLRHPGVQGAARRRATGSSW